jgi:hypothetical protein
MPPARTDAPAGTAARIQGHPTWAWTGAKYKIVHFLQFYQCSDAEAISALARAYLYSDLSPDDLAAAEGAMIMLLDDPSPLVRRALAEVFASAEMAPQIVVHALAARRFAKTCWLGRICQWRCARRCSQSYRKRLLDSLPCGDG